eukprot:ctg_366.g209
MSVPEDDERCEYNGNDATDHAQRRPVGRTGNSDAHGGNRPATPRPSECVIRTRSSPLRLAGESLHRDLGKTEGTRAADSRSGRATFVRTPTATRTPESDSHTRSSRRARPPAHHLQSMPGNGVNVEHAREPCPDRILDDVGGAFSMGAIGGTLWHFVKGARNSPRGQRFLGGVDAVKLKAPVLGGSFAVWGGLFSTFDCALSGVRGVEDPYNAIASGAITGGLGIALTRMTVELGPTPEEVERMQREMLEQQQRGRQTSEAEAQRRESLGVGAGDLVLTEHSGVPPTPPAADLSSIAAAAGNDRGATGNEAADGAASGSSGGGGIFRGLFG